MWHTWRPTLGRVPAYNASSPERSIGPQLISVTGPIARSVEDRRVALMAMSAPDPRDPWWVPAPLEGPSIPLHAALCLRPGGTQIQEEVAAAVLDAGRRLADAGWEVEELEDTPPLHEADQVTFDLWFGDGFAGQADAAKHDGDPGALAVIAGVPAKAEAHPEDVVAHSLVRRTTLVREWLPFLTKYPVLLLPLSTELPFPDGLDLQGEGGFARVWKAQSSEVIKLPKPQIQR